MTWKDIAELFQTIELRLIASLKRNLARHKAEEAEYGFSWPAWQAEKLRNLEAFRRSNRKIMAEYTPLIDNDVSVLLTEQYAEGVNQVEAEAQPLPAHDAFFGVNERRIHALTDEVNAHLHKAESAALRLVDDVYRQTIFRAEMAAATGAVTMQQAVDLAVKDFLSAGINCVQYKDGRRVNIVTYAEMALRTASLRSFLRGEADRRAQLGIDTVLVSQYGACSDTCLPWQGRVYIDDVWGVFDGEISGGRGKSRNGHKYPVLSVAVAAGLFHPNCRHTLSTWMEGISVRPKPLDAEMVRRNAKREQQQRRLENLVRKTKRLAEGTVDPEQARTYQRQVRAAQAQLRQLVHQHGDVLRRDYWREQTHGVPADMGKTADRDLKIAANPGILITGGDNMATDISIDKFTPCLEDNATGELVKTAYGLATKQELSELKDWNFDWTADDLKHAEVYKLTVKDNTEIQGLVALTKFERDRAVYVNIAESAPRNMGANKRYSGVGGHLFAIAAKRSIDLGYDGFVFMDAKNPELVQHYHDTLGATLLGMPHQYRMFIDEEAAARLLDTYTLEEG